MKRTRPAVPTRRIVRPRPEDLKLVVYTGARGDDLRLIPTGERALVPIGQQKRVRTEEPTYRISRVRLNPIYDGDAMFESTFSQNSGALIDVGFDGETAFESRLANSSAAMDAENIFAHPGFEETIESESSSRFSSAAPPPSKPPSTPPPSTPASPTPPAAQSFVPTAALARLTPEQLISLAPYGSLLRFMSPEQVAQLVALGDGNSTDGRAVISSRPPRRATHIPPVRKSVLLDGGRKILV